MKCLWILAQRWFSEIYLAQFWHSWRRLLRAHLLVRKRGLLDVQSLGRSGQVEFFGNGDEATQTAKFH
jgi:hypothetical protein